MIDLAIGERIKRVELHERYGGRRQGGISPSAKTPNVFAITAPTGAQYGYIYDGLGEDGYYHYTGEGQLGDQQMVQGNRAIRDHEEEGRDLHLFEAYGTELEYVGQYRFHDSYEGDAPEVGSEELRKVIVFRLDQLSGKKVGPALRRVDRLGSESVKEIPVEQQLTERTVIEGNREPHESERREQTLVLAFASYLEAKGHEVCRLQLRPSGEAAPLFCDLFDKTNNVLYESKGSTARGAIRMAIGQLADYSRMLAPRPRCAVLLPERPREDLVELLTDQSISVIYPQEESLGYSNTGTEVLS